MKRFITISFLLSLFLLADLSASAQQGIITTIAGGDNYFNGLGDGGLATLANLNLPTDVAVDSFGNIFIADQRNARIRKVDKNGIITTIAGNGTAGYTGDGTPATSAQLNNPEGVAIDSQGNILISDRDNNCIRKVDKNGIITTIAGNGTAGYTGDGGLATNAQLNHPCGLVVDALGNIFIADRDNYRVRKIDTNRIITTVAGNGIHGTAGDGGIATDAELGAVTDVAIDKFGNIFIANGEIFGLSAK